MLLTATLDRARFHLAAEMRLTTRDRLMVRGGKPTARAAIQYPEVARYSRMYYTAPGIPSRCVHLFRRHLQALLFCRLSCDC